MISYDLAMEHLYASAYLLEPESIPLMHSCRRVTCENIVSPMMSPPFNNAAMDGFALNAEETQLATIENPLYFAIKDIQAAGQTSAFFGKKTTIKIMTGAPLPEGYNSVLVVEEANITQINQEFLLCITKPLNPNHNVRCRGEDIQDQELLIKSGDILNASRLMTLATVGVAKLLVTRQPRVCLLSTGTEIIDDYDKPLSDAEIYNSNYPYLSNALRSSGIEGQYLGNFADDLDLFKTRMGQILNNKEGPDIIISTGAVSQGDYDYIPQALRDLGGKILFHGVYIRPGKPILFAELDKKYYFGLPGNPISTAVGYQFFIYPFIRRLQGLPSDTPILAKLKNAFVKKGFFRQFLKARAYLDPEGQLCVMILNHQESSRVKPFLEANAWVIVKEEVTTLNLGDVVPLVFMPYGQLEDLICE